jgi:hypothetical protein
MSLLWDGLYLSLSLMPIVVGVSLMFGVLRIVTKGSRKCFTPYAA